METSSAWRHMVELLAIGSEVEDAAKYSPFDRADRRNRLSEVDAPYLRGEPAPLRVLVPVTMEG